MYAENRHSHNWLAKKAINDQFCRQLRTFAGSVLDLGCGTRPFEEDIVAQGAYYIGVDWANSLHASHQDVTCDLNCGIPFISECIDHVVCFEVMEHLREPARMLEEAWRVLRSGGTMALSVPFQWWLHEEPWDYYRFTIHGLRYMFETVGFVDVRVTPTTGFWTMWILKLNYQTVRLIRGPRFARHLIRSLLIPFWWCGQHAAGTADRFWPDYRETVGYFVVARKP